VITNQPILELHIVTLLPTPHHLSKRRQPRKSRIVDPTTTVQMLSPNLSLRPQHSGRLKRLVSMNISQRPQIPHRDRLIGMIRLTMVQIHMLLRTEHHLMPGSDSISTEPSPDDHTPRQRPGIIPGHRPPPE
jgi:hypothetical protein